MTKQEWQRREHLRKALTSLGFTDDEVEKLRRISNTLQRWYELECGNDRGCIERDEVSGIPQWRHATDTGRYCGFPIPDRERGAVKRLKEIINARNDRVLMSGAAIDVKNPPLLGWYLQTDPRGAALYILRPGDVPAGADASAYYNRGICVY